MEMAYQPHREAAGEPPSPVAAQDVGLAMEEAEVYAGPHPRESVALLGREGHPRAAVTCRQMLSYVAVFAASVGCSVLVGIIFARQPQAITSVPSGVMVSKVAFGSCTAYDMEPQPVWEQGVVPSTPDAWIWLGDLAYMDNPTVNCELLPAHPNCNCTPDWLHIPHHGCQAGDIEHARARAQAQVEHPDYGKLLEYMCPGHRQAGLFPPPGADPQVCPRAIVGTYDDHDFTWNNGNGRLPGKHLAKQVFLDAIGEPALSMRRNWERGIEWQHSFNAHRPDRQIDVFLLDERYNRAALPCATRRRWCEELVLPLHHAGPAGLGLDPSALNATQLQALEKYMKAAGKYYAWCEDFLYGGDMGEGSCCGRDEALDGWCADVADTSHPLYDIACNPLSPEYASEMVVVEGRVLRRYDAARDPVDVRLESPICEMLGLQQRRWLDQALFASPAPLKLLVSGSVLFGHGGWEAPCWDADLLTGAPVPCECSGDDWDCYRRAQQALLATLHRTVLNRDPQQAGCVVVLTGDYHWHDIKVVRAGPGPAYSAAYLGASAQRPLYQVMSSGLTSSTGVPDQPCETFRRDPQGLRDHPECDFVTGPGFGMVEVDWDARVVHLQVRSGENGTTLLQSTISLDTCEAL